VRSRRGFGCVHYRRGRNLFPFSKKTVPDISNAIKQQMSAAASFITWSAKLGCLQWHA
jgi:hypothetical protein